MPASPKSASPETGFAGHARSGDVQLHFRRFGQLGSTPLVIAHGLSYFSYDWTAAATALSTDREVVAVDTRGFGDSDASAAVTTACRP